MPSLRDSRHWLTILLLQLMHYVTPKYYLPDLEIIMPQICKIWTDFHCADVQGDDANGFVVTSSRGGNYKLTGTLANTSEFLDLNIDERVRLTDYIVEQNAQGIIPTFGSGDIANAISRPRKRTSDREIALLKLVYQRNPHLGASVALADSTGLLGVHMNDYNNPVVANYYSQLAEFQAITSSRNVKDVHNLANALIANGRLADGSRNTRYILSHEVFKEIEEGRLGISQNFYGDSSSISRFFSTDAKIRSSQIEECVKNLISADLEQARLAYITKAYKSVVVMLGGALEGVMLGTLRRDDVITYLQGNPNKVPNALSNIGTNHPEFKTKLGDELRFNDMRINLEKLVPTIATAGVGDIQDFRNAIHPNKALANATFTDFDETRATNYITAFDKIVDLLVNWVP